jgi:hypothetical protein
MHAYDPMADSTTQRDLSALATARHGALSPAERTLFEAAENGDIADCSQLLEDERKIRANCLVWLCTSSEAAHLVTYRGISLLKATIDDHLNLDWAKIPFPLRLQKCLLSGDVLLRNSNLVLLNLLECSMRILAAQRIVVERDVLLYGLQCTLVVLRGAAIGGDLDLRRGQLLNKDGAEALDANSASFKGNVFLSDGFRAQGQVSLASATVGGNVNCNEGEFVSKRPESALQANGAKVSGVFLAKGCTVEGTVELTAATIGGNLECDGARFTSHGNAPALDARSAKVGLSLFLRNGFEAEGQVNIGAATIGLNLECVGGQFRSKSDDPALNANSASINGHVFLGSGFKSEGTVALVGAMIAGSLQCSGGQFLSKNDAPALNANSASINGHAFLRRGFKADGAVELVGATIGRSLDCDGGQFLSKNDAPALNANSASINGHICLRGGFKAAGSVDLSAVNIRGGLEFSGGKFVSKTDDPALNISFAEIGSHVILGQGFEAEGTVSFVSSRIGGTLNCERGQFVGVGGRRALDVDTATIGGAIYFRNKTKVDGEVSLAFATVSRSLQWHDIITTERTALRLNSARVGTLFNDPAGMKQGSLFLHDFVYQQIDDRARPNAKAQLSWIHLESRENYSSQAYEQLASVFRKRGLQEDARKVLIQKNKDYTAYSFPSLAFWRPEWWWYGLFGKLIGYGYRPWRAFVLSLVLILFGWLCFHLGFQSGLVTPTGDKAYVVDVAGIQRISENYPKFSSLVYSLENFVPLLKLGMSDRWTPNPNRGPVIQVGPLGPIKIKTSWGSALRYYLWCHIIAGWVLTSLWVGGLTGLVKS